MHPIADAAAALGSRFNLIFDPHARRVYHNAYGVFHEKPLELTVGVRAPDGRTHCLPFAHGGEIFPYLEMFSTLTTIEYRGMHPDVGIEFRMKIRAPFYPRAVRLSTAPFCFVTLEVRSLGRFRWREPGQRLEQGQIVFQITGEDLEFKKLKDGFSYTFASATAARHEPAAAENTASRTHPASGFVHVPEGNAAKKNGWEADFDLKEKEIARVELIWSGWTDEPVLDVRGERTAFKYHEFFSSEKEMTTWARKKKERINERCDFLDSMVLDWSLGQATSNLAALALHSFLVNTWWTTTGDGGDWFSVWEGSCYYHSTIDVEYNDALVYFALWPELLDMLLDEWAEFEMDGKLTLGEGGEGTAFLCHDMGSGCRVGRQHYDHHMEVEENANYLLMLAARTFASGDTGRAAKQLPLCRRLAQFIVKTDTTGNGFPDLGTATTMDDAGPAVQFGRDQMYLAVKAQAALWCLAELEERCDPKHSKAERWRAFASKSIKTMDAEGWLDDHYAVCLSRTTEGLIDPWTGESLPDGELPGWDDYSIYTANGLLYMFLGGIKMPRWKRGRLSTDIENAERHTRTPYGCRHTAQSGQAIWLSQNIWRDCLAAYLGVDMLNNVERYWDYQVLSGDNLLSSLFYDTTTDNNLCFYPRGAVIFGAPPAAAGLRLNRLDGELVLSPVRQTLRVPLLPLVDWQAMRAPVLTVRNREGVAVATISQKQLLEGLKLTVLNVEMAED